MNDRKLQQLEAEIQQELSESLKDSNFGKVLKKYGILGKNVLKFQCIIDLSQLQPSDCAGNQELEEFLKTSSEQTFTINGCGWCVPCPAPPYNPLGCYACNCP
ncbi:hypothetical protein NIES4074_47420 [Cylindrospermum sp. NIES-4074]|nr:hypothetical protein NIES4074_47420 [Cylindrospermum sp. NIES-4074]